MSDAVYDYLANEIAKFIDNDPSETLYHRVLEAARNAVRDDMGTGYTREMYAEMLRGRGDRYEYEHAVGPAVVEVIRAWLDECDDSPPLALLRELLDLDASAISDRLGEHYLPTDIDDIEWDEDESDEDPDDED